MDLCMYLGGWAMSVNMIEISWISSWILLWYIMLYYGDGDGDGDGDS